MCTGGATAAEFEAADVEDVVNSPNDTNQRVGGGSAASVPAFELSSTSKYKVFVTGKQFEEGSDNIRQRWTTLTGGVPVPDLLTALDSPAPIRSWPSPPTPPAASRKDIMTLVAREASRRSSSGRLVGVVAAFKKIHDRVTYEGSSSASSTSEEGAETGTVHDPRTLVRSSSSQSSGRSAGARRVKDSPTKVHPGGTAPAERA